MGNATIRYSAYDFLFDFNRNYVSVFYHFRDIAGYLSKVADFDHPICWWRGTVVERRSLAGELSLSCARSEADG